MKIRTWGTVVGLVGFGFCVACGGGQTPPAESPAELSGEESAAASSEKVKRASDALREEQFEEAERLLLAAVEEDPQDPQAAFYLGVAQEGLEKWEEAEASYRRALALDAGLTEASINLSSLLLNEERDEEALRVAEQGLKKAPEDLALLTNRALALPVDSPEAVRAFESVLEKKPSDVWSRLSYAFALKENGREEAARQELSKISVEDAELGIEVAKFYASGKDFEACSATLSKVLEKTRNVELLLRRAVCEHSAGKNQRAEEDFQAALAMDADSPEANYYWGRYLSVSGKKADARKFLEKAARGGQGTPTGQAAEKLLSEK